jgi:hypothetical protein
MSLDNGSSLQLKELKAATFRIKRYRRGDSASRRVFRLSTMWRCSSNDRLWPIVASCDRYMRLNFEHH